MPKSPASRKGKMTLAEKRAFNARLLEDPKIKQMIREGLEAQARGEGTRWEDLRPSDGRR